MAITVIRTARTLEAEWWQVCGEAWVGDKGNESSTGRVSAVGFHHVTVRSRLARVLKLMNRLFLQFSKFFFFGPRPTADTESTDMAVHPPVLVTPQQNDYTQNSTT